MSSMYKLGKKPPAVDKRTRCFARYLSLPTPPASVTYYDKVATRPMYYNDKYGDCTCARSCPHDSERDG